MSKKSRSSTGIIVFLVVLILLLVLALGVMAFSLYGLGVVSVGSSRTEEPVLSLQPAPTQTPPQTTAPARTQPPAELPVTVASPTPSPTPQPTVLPDFADSYYDSYFDDAVFVGDSVTQGLQIYTMYCQGLGETTLGQAKFLAAASYNLATAGKPFDESRKVNLTYQGTAMSIEDAVSAMGAKHMFVMLGLNDWAGSAVQANANLYRAMLERILTAIPDLCVTVMSCTPVTPNGEKPKINSANMDQFNEALQALCLEMGIEYLDVGTPLKNQDGKLNPAYSSDDYVHLNNDGLAIWVNTLRGYALWHEVAALEQQGQPCQVPEDAPARESIYFFDPALPDTLPPIEQAPEVSASPETSSTPEAASQAPESTPQPTASEAPTQTAIPTVTPDAPVTPEPMPLPTLDPMDRAEPLG